MAGVSRVMVDTAGGLISGSLAAGVFVNGSPIAVKGAAVLPHGSGAHAAPVMVGGSSKVYARGIGVCRQGDNASCGHTATGSSTVFAN